MNPYQNGGTIMDEKDCTILQRETEIKMLIERIEHIEMQGAIEIEGLLGRIDELEIQVENLEAKIEDLLYAEGMD